MLMCCIVFALLACLRTQLGSLAYARYTLLLVVLCSAVMTAMIWARVRFLRHERERVQFCLGYSGWVLAFPVCCSF